MSDTNRAAEGLRRMFSIPEGEALNKAMGWTLNETFDAALAHERSAGAAPLDVERLAETEDCLLRECDHEYTADCVDDFRARLIERTDQ